MDDLLRLAPGNVEDEEDDRETTQHYSFYCDQSDVFSMTSYLPTNRLYPTLDDANDEEKQEGKEPTTVLPQIREEHGKEDAHSKTKSVEELWIQ